MHVGDSGGREVAAPTHTLWVSWPRLGSARDMTRVRPGLIPRWSMSVIGEMRYLSEPPQA